jgi:DNA invertase Pin-like site-specific DNA recombinase
MTKQAIGYIRVSSDDQANSLLAQEEKILAYAKFSGIEIVNIFIDENVSGGTPIFKRPQGSKIESFMEGNAISDIVCVKPDRAFRSVIDALSTMDQWNAQGISLHVSDMGGVSLNTTTAIGRLLFTTIVTLGEFERGITSERIKTVFESKKKNGKIYSRDMYGYDNSMGSMVENAEEQRVISVMRQLKDQGTPYAGIASHVNMLGLKSKTGKEFHASTVRYILLNPVNNKAA